MSKEYIVDLFDLTTESVEEGDIVRFEMPPFCSGEYLQEVKSNQGQLYIDEFWEGCRDYELIKKSSEHYQTFKDLL